MAEAIDTAYVVVKPDTRAFGSETRRQVAQQLRSQPVAAPRIKPQKQRDLIPRVGVRGAGLGLVGLGTTLTGITGGAIAFGIAFKTAMNEVKEGQAVMAQTNAVLKSTGNVAGVSAKGVQSYAGELSKLSGIDDEVVQAGENIILTFKNVRNVGTGSNAIFDRTTKAAVDLAKFGGGAFGDMNSASKQLGKALNDPIKGMTALSRSGITFSQGQKDTIKQLVETGHTLAAQKLILKEVESQVGGSAEAYGKTLPGAIDRTKNSIANLLGAGLERGIPGLTEAANGVAAFFESLEQGRGAGAEINGTFAAIKSAVVPLFKTMRAEGPRLKRIFENLRESFRDMIPILKVLGTIIGVVLVVAFKLWARQAEAVTGAYKKFTHFMLTVYVKTIDFVLAATEKILDATAKFASVINKLSPGNPMKGVESGANRAKEAIIAARQELQNLDGRQATVKVNVVTTDRGSSLGGAGHTGAVAPDATGGADVTGSKAEKIGPRAAQEIRLQNALTLARTTEQTNADDKAALNALIGFYREGMRIAAERGRGTKLYQAKINEAQNEINSLNQQAADAATQAASDAKADHDRLLAANDQERRDLLNFKIQLAAGTKRIIRDDKAAWAAYIAYLKERVAIAKKAKSGIAAAKAELRQARIDAAQTVKDFVQAKFDEQEAFLQGQVDLFDVTGQEGKLAASYKRLIAFYKRMVKREGLTRLERQKYRIALAQTRKDLKEIGNETGAAGKDGATFGQLAADFLKNLHGFSSNLASNVMPRGTTTGLTEAVVAATVRAKTAAKDAATVGTNVRIQAGIDPRTGRPIRESGGRSPVRVEAGIDPATGRPLRESGKPLAPRGATAAEQALAHRESAQGPATAAQFERLLSQNASILRVLRRIAQDQDHPQAKFNRKQSPAAVVVGVS